MNCKGLRTVSFESLLEAHRAGEATNLYHFGLKIKISVQVITIIDLLQLFSQLNIPLLEMFINPIDQETTIVDFLLKVDNPAKI